MFDTHVSDSNKPCKSDHFPVNFALKSKARRIKSPKRSLYNYKRADWDGLEAALCSVDWDAELEGDIEDAWASFKRILVSTVDKFIP